MVHTRSTKTTISKALKGRPKSPATRRRMSQSHLAYRRRVAEALHEQERGKVTGIIVVPTDTDRKGA